MIDLAHLHSGCLQGYRWLRTWKEGRARVDVEFTAEGRVMAAAGRGKPPIDNLARLRAWLDWLRGGYPRT